MMTSGQIPTASTNLLHFTAFVFAFDTKLGFDINWPSSLTLLPVAPYELYGASGLS